MIWINLYTCLMSPDISPSQMVKHPAYIAIINDSKIKEAEKIFKDYCKS